ncbi:pilus assembly protein TadG-related protein [Streptomyces sp. NPDC093094]|uniref:pilus assembly protein TadG-related protein n=1 Tax=Streptomyces sp. NPDC093094 TaxID=3366026 RepID=UPI003800BC2E
MTRHRTCGDAGQAFPIYITVVGGLLFLALAYLAVGQAGASRGETQTAADAAALAAALEERDQLADAWIANIREPAKWLEIFAGLAPGLEPSCGRAYELAAMNDATADCDPDGPLRFTVTVDANEPVGDSIVPGTESFYAEADAAAVIEPRCTFDPLGEGAEEEALPELVCGDEGEVWDLDPEDLDDLPKPEDLFDVHLAD